MSRVGLTQKELSRRAGIDEATVSDVMRGGTGNPNWATVERLVNAIDTTWGELFEEARMQLSTRDAALVGDFKDFLERLLKTDAERKRQRRAEPAKRARRHAPDEVILLPKETIPEAFVRAGARQAYRVISDAMSGIGIFEDSVVYARPSRNLDAVHGEVAIVRLNKTLFLKRVERRNRQMVLMSENHRYGDIHVGGRDDFELVAIVIL